MRRKTTTTEASIDGVFALIAGESGAGKTFLAKTLPESETLIISKESGLLSLCGTNIDVEEIDSFMDFAEIITEIQGGSYPHQNIYIDSLTDILETEVLDLKRKYPDKKDSFKWYDEYERKLKWSIMSLRDIKNKNIFFTCLTAQEKDGMHMVDQFDFYGTKLKGKIKAYFDLVMHLKVFNDDELGMYRGLVTAYTESSLAKDRSGKLLPIEKPDLGHIINKIKGE